MRQDRLDQIQDIIYFLDKYWKQNPELRLCQILGNKFPGDNYYTNDQEVIDYLVKLVNEVKD
jgi:uncharacterized protein YihD (DUF1040 family)